ncbi:MAG: hypothetical protein PHX80_05720 [Candidatus Nanoarchaeia archaeon]|nr:hypothetical protein [Candidatus Nanoarchaeia archaeon]MDD5547276.1 hypothetical protein [Candidatus Omnitrophota bacterium]
MLAIIDAVKRQSLLPFRSICHTMKLPYGNVMRWRQRRQAPLPCVRRPGPKKIAPLDLSALSAGIGQLAHGVKRTIGAGDLYRRYAAGISRRVLMALVAMARHDVHTDQRNNLRRIAWLAPGVIWAMDASEYEQRDAQGKKVYLNQVQDLASRYKFSPMAGECPCGEEIAGYLAAQFKRFGAPLFLKRDNGGNMNHAAINDVLSEYFVIPLNSPVYYAPYNGGIEHAQGELKSELRSLLSMASACPREHIEAYSAAAAHNLNHGQRPCLNGQNACQAFFTTKQTFTKRQRRNVYEWIVALQKHILENMKDNQKSSAESAWRIAVESWLRKNGSITVTINKKVLPVFQEIRTHN